MDFLKAFGLGMVAALVAVVGTLLGWWLGFSAVMRDPNVNAQWLPVASAGGSRAVAFLGWRDGAGMLVRTDASEVLACRPPEACTLVTSQMVTEPAIVLEPSPKEPPAGAVETVAITHRGVCLHTDLFARLDDGSVWSMSLKPSCCEIGCLIPLVFGLLGAGSGLAASVVALVAFWAIHRRCRRSVAPPPP